ncbi:T6SS effector BTH_I2691 family protein [Salinicola sp. DM10]|uniref:T6SS effector BTH_I2691 family protein n=1 Tax=Salinicola sp. DM10 TaxID=2815721 RepID=UPI001A8D3BF0|nr:T6SS effector BTH_I2691 family protein [Salinicola sp. DM10]MCE3028627.1 hypothetical protein [Salinicola sp. DM10]
MSAIPDINEAVATAVANTSGGNTDASAETGGCSDCQMCQKSPGLVILPVRYSAIAESHAHSISGLAPITSGGNFGEGVLDKAMQRATYIVRSMRAGYFYMHFPSGDADGVIWRKYRVTSDSNFMPIPLDGHLTPNMEANKACRRSSDWQMARCVTISQPEKVTQAWLAFSDTDWDATVRDRIARDPATRMQPLNPSLCISPAAGQPHTAPLSAVSDWVSEYRHNAWQSFHSTVADEDDPHNTAKFESVYPFHWRAIEADDLVETAERKSQGRAILFATHDPRGITFELNAEQIQAVSASLQRFSWRLSSWAGIQTIRESVGNQAEKRQRQSVLLRDPEMLEYNELQLQQINARIEMVGPSEHQLRFRDELQEENDIIAARIAHKEATSERLTDESIKEVREAAWEETREGQKFLARTDKQIEDDYQSVKETLKADSESIDIPLSQDHATWLDSPDLKRIFSSDYRTDELDSGVNYVNHFVDCIDDAADREECAEILRTWASAGNPTDPENPLLRSLGHNQDDHLAEIDSAPPLTVQSAVTILDKFNAAWQKSAKAMLNPETSETAGRNAFTRLIYHSGAPVAKLLSQGVEGTAKNLYLMASMFSTDQWIVERPLRGTPTQFVNLLAEEMRLAIPANKRPSRLQMQRALREMLKRTGQYDQIGSQHFVFVDRARLAAIGDGQGAGRATAERILRSREPIVLTPRNIREGIMPGFQKAMSGEVRMNAVSLFFSGISWYYAGKALDNANSFSRRELSVKFWASLAGVVGGLCETVEAGVKGLVAAGQQFSDGTKSLFKTVGKIGRFLGAGVAFVFAVYDVMHAVEEVVKGNYGLSALYLASAAGGFALGYIAIAAGVFSLLGMALVLAMLGIGFLIGILTDSKTQQWLSHCFYGFADRFPNIEESQQELNDIFRG